MLAVVLRDATDERRARDELARGALYHRALVANALDSITIVDADGLVLYQSPASRALLGFPPEELVGLPLRLAFAEDRLRARRVLAEVGAAPGRSGRLVYRTFDAQGRLHWMEGLISNHLDNPLVGGLVLNSRDVTEKRALERGLREADRLRVAGLLGATVAHDMNNMIAVVHHGLEALEGRPSPDQEVAARLVIMREALARTSELTRRLMAIGGRGGGAAERVDLGRAVRGLRGLLETILRKGQALEVDVAEGEHPVQVQVQELEQVVVNLVVNARDALTARGRIAVRVQRRPGGPYPRVALVVEDDGAGMDETTRARIFEPFFTTKDPGQGTGLGMVVVETFVREAGGEIEIRSAPGRGTAVELLLPIAVPQDEPSPWTA
ncbi:ATP-binding protein [Myxococcota bacterium]|nr:ATP-binding protein [Myxococcota bacterium]